MTPCSTRSCTHCGVAFRIVHARGASFVDRERAALELFTTSHSATCPLLARKGAAVGRTIDLVLSEGAARNPTLIEPSVPLPRPPQSGGSEAWLRRLASKTGLALEE